ncbi:cellulose synthase A catalytic subunit 4 [UDP-forming]-like, partial [Morus notabilis]
MKLRQAYGPSNELVASLCSENDKPHVMKNGGDTTSILEEMKLLASCTYEIGTKWGEEVGYLYGSVAENYFTGFTLHSKGWISVYCDPPRPQFLGCATTTLNDCLTQSTRWCSGFFDVGISKYCRFIYRPWRVSILHKMCYAELALPLSFFPLWGFATIPQLCLINGIPIYPK